MTSEDSNSSAFHEPHLRPGPPAFSKDPSEASRGGRERFEPAGAESTYRDGHSIWDEPDILPGRSDSLIGQDWLCSACGYNLRGLFVGQRCPECGRVELYRPPPPGVNSYRTWLLRQIGQTEPETCWLVALGAALVGGLWAVIASLIGTQHAGVGGWSTFLLAVVYAPTVEETMKIAAGAYVVELRPYWFQRQEQIHLATVGAAVVFAVIENLIYLYVFVQGPTVKLALWRWLVCTALHAGCTYLAAGGLVEVWRQALTEYRRPRITRALRYLVPAIILHGAYNGSMIAAEGIFGPFLR